MVVDKRWTRPLSLVKSKGTTRVTLLRLCIHIRSLTHTEVVIVYKILTKYINWTNKYERTNDGHVVCRRGAFALCIHTPSHTYMYVPWIINSRLLFPSNRALVINLIDIHTHTCTVHTHTPLRAPSLIYTRFHCAFAVSCSLSLHRLLIAQSSTIYLFSFCSNKPSHRATSD